MDHRNHGLQNLPPRRSTQYDPVHSVSTSWVSHPHSQNPGHYLWTTNSTGLPQPWGYPAHSQQAPGPDSFQLAQNGALLQPNPAAYGLPPPNTDPSSGEFHLRQFYHPFQRLSNQPMASPNHPGPDHRMYPDHAVTSRLAAFRPAAPSSVPTSSLPPTSELNSLQNYAPPPELANAIPQLNNTYGNYPHPPPPPPHLFEPTSSRHHHHHTHHHPHHYISPTSARPTGVVDVPHATRSSIASSGPRRTIRSRRSIAVRTMNDEDELRPPNSSRRPASLSADLDEEEARIVRQMQLIRGSVTSRLVASNSTLESLVRVKVADLPEGERTCIICYNDFDVETPEGITEAPIRLPGCGHVFGEHCIKQWLEDSDTCPYCRDKLDSVIRIKGRDVRSFINLMRVGTANSLPAGALEDEIVLRVIEGAQLGASNRGQNNRRSPPLDSNGQSRRIRPRRTGSIYPSPLQPSDVLASSNSTSTARDTPARAYVPPLTHTQSPERLSTRPSESAAQPYPGAPTVANGSNAVPPSASNFWPQGWVAPGEADIVANPLHSHHSSSGESDEDT